ncbi:MAG: NAD(P)H-dependent glycerol-3-phosphate dehydrogenase [Burkholderiales bacterium]
MRLSVLGAGAWGTAISISLAPRHAVTLWARNAERAHDIATARANQAYLPGSRIPDNVAVSADLTEALASCDLILVATTTAGLRDVLRRIAAAQCAAPVLWLCKGFDTDQAQLPHQVAATELPAAQPRGVLSGPSFAQEVACGLPTALTLASADPVFAQRMARELHHDRLRIYSADDLAGVEVAGAIKNVMAIAAGISDGLGLGYNARAALITRGLAEITRMGRRLGGRMETFMGLAGIGDLVLTCTGDLSRNRRVGLGLAKGAPLEQLLAKLGHVAEGVYTARAVSSLAGELRVDMPITRAVSRVMDERVPARDAVQELLQRDPKAER